MRKILSSHSEVAHYWANQKQPEGKSGNIFFVGDTIYSYGYHFPVAKIVSKTTILLTTASYSVSTAKHMSIIRSAIPYYYEILYVPNIEDTTKTRRSLTGLFEKNLSLASRARTKKGMYLTQCLNALDQYKKAHPYMQEFSPKDHKKWVKTWDGIFNNEVTTILEAYQTQLDKEKQKTIRENKKQMKKALEYAKRWKNDNTLPTMSNSYLVQNVLLRIKDGQVETSKGARVPVEKAKVLWQMIKRNKPIHGYVLDGYTVIGFTDDILTIGCHKIERKEVERIGNLLEQDVNNDGGSIASTPKV